MYSIASILESHRGSIPRPGEISLAHNGVLFLDELAEFDRKVLEVLREPLETGMVTISRAARQSDFPARFQLIAAMNPCPCGYLGHISGRCHCTPDMISRYLNKISGPFLDRIDVQIQVAAVAHEDLLKSKDAEGSVKIQQRVEQAYRRQMERQGKANNRLSSAEIELYCQHDQASADLLRQAMMKFNWSARAYHRVLKMARSIADLAGVEQITRLHMAESIHYRCGI